MHGEDIKGWVAGIRVECSVFWGGGGANRSLEPLDGVCLADRIFGVRVKGVGTRVGC